MYSPKQTPSRNFLETKHFRATIEFRVTHPVVVTISAVKNISSASEMSREELEHWFWFTNIVLRVLNQSFGTTDFAVLSSKLDGSADASAKSLPAVLVLDHKAARDVGLDAELYWYSSRPPNKQGRYTVPPNDIVERIALQLSRQAQALVSSSR